MGGSGPKSPLASLFPLVARPQKRLLGLIISGCIIANQITSLVTAWVVVQVAPERVRMLSVPCSTA